VSNDMIQAAPLEAYSQQDREFFAFWYSHMQGDLMQPPLAGISHSTARYIWDSALAAPKPQSSGGEVDFAQSIVAESHGRYTLATSRAAFQAGAIYGQQLATLATPKPEPMTEHQRGNIVMEHLGLPALMGDKMSPLDAFTLGIEATERFYGITKGEA